MSADTERLREALEQALDRMNTAWGLLHPDIWSDAARVQGGPAEGVSQALYFGIEEAERALVASPVDHCERHDGKTFRCEQDGPWCRWPVDTQLSTQSDPSTNPGEGR